MEDSERAEYWSEAYKRMAARNAEQGLLIAELDAEIRELRTGAYLVKVIEQRECYRKALDNVDALDPESMAAGCTTDALRGLVTQMGRIARTALESTNEPT